MPIDSSIKSPPLLHGVVLVAGGAVGAGMFALPMISAGAGFFWAVIGLFMIWLATYLASLVLLEVNLRFKPGASFDTMVRARLGSTWASINNLSITFIMMILMYAYTTAGASIIEPLVIANFEQGSRPSRGLLSLLFGSLVGLIVWLGTNMVSRLSAVLLVAMAMAFISAITGLTMHIDLGLLVPPWNRISNQLGFVWVTLPVFVTAFACGGLVPSLIKHYKAEPNKVRRSLLFGTLASLVIYIIWLSVTLGTLSQSSLKEVLLAGGSTADLVNSLQTTQLAGLSGSEMSSTNLALTKRLSQSLVVFSHFAIITSFLSIGIGLFHFIADRFAFRDNTIGKSQTALISFLPPILMSFFIPFGFVSAIGYAGLAVVFSFFIVPVLMLKKQHQLNARNKAEIANRVASNHLLNALLLFSMMIVVLKVLTIFSWLPSFS